ncbi:MAG: amino acid adenylation domain-containing protein [Candidatus Aminicenantes bacterium]|nr:amino acid adenylation domain-containing protein [Candidatus Aminicenantes bacterium]
MEIDEYVAAAQNTREKEYWLNKLSGELVKSNFYYDSKSKSVDIYRSGKEEFRFTGELFSKFLQLSNNSDLRLHMILTAGLAILIEKYTGQKDIIIGTPIYKQEVEVKFVNTVLALRNVIDTRMTFKEILVQVRQTITGAVEHVNYPIELISEQLGMPVSKGNDFPLFDIVILLENIHDKKYVEHINHNIMFSLLRKEDALEGVVEYNAQRYRKETIQQIVNHFMAIFEQVLVDVNLKVSKVEIVSEVEKRKLLNEFNDTRAAFPNDKTIHELFAEQAERTPGNIAVCSPADLSDIFTPAACFKKNPYIFESDLEMRAFKLLKTHAHNSVVINKHMLELIDAFTGENNLESVFSILKDFTNAKFIIFTARMKDMLGITHDFNRQADVFSNMSYSDFISLVQLLYKNTLIKFHGVKSGTTIPGNAVLGPDFSEADEPFDARVVLKDLLTSDEAGLVKADVLLLGDTNGMPTTGLLYMASFLRRNGVKALCRFYDDADTFQSMAADIEKMLGQIQPRVVGVSMKWFLYIARVVDMCKIIKEYSRRHGLDIKVVVGGNTASYYWQEIIDYDFIDYVVRGDGEQPLLKIFRGEKDIPNCIYKQNGKIIENPITYIQDGKNSSEIYLSHLDEILLSNAASLFGTFFVYTHKGCAMNCLYCGGCNKAQQKAFNRKKVFRRGVEETRKDIIEIKKYASTFHFEFDILDKNLADYCRKIWEGIDLSGHFCLFNTLTPPTTELVELVSRTFKYVYWDFDICTPSERHRKQLESLGLVKPQPTDAEIMDFMTKCEKFKNIEVRPNLITGLPYFTLADIEPGEKLLTEIMSTFSCFSELHWARLHAQPGAPILEYADQVQMYSFATSFEDFLKYSRENFNRDSGYVSVENFNYPYIYFRDDHLNSRITNFYLEINQKINQHKNDKTNDLIISETITYGALNERAERLAATLIARGVKPGDIVGLMLERSIAIPVGILAVLKCGAAYLPIDPEFPTGRVEYMLKDSGAKLLVTTNDKEGEKLRSWEGEKVLLEEISNFPKSSSYPLTFLPSYLLNSSNLAYIIYTSGTTGKPKGVAINHENLVNYVNWFSKKVGLTEQDKTILTTSFAFDLGYTSLYNSLLNGGELHILPREIYLLAERLLSYIKQNEITFIKVTPSLFSVIVNSPGFSKITCRSLRLAAMGGEPINVKDIEKAHLICSHLTIMNHYGPTETTIGCAATIIDFADFEEYKAHPVIGKPIANAGIYILGKDLDLLPVGAPGELCISGAGVGVGYLNRPELTAEKFIHFHHSSFIIHHLKLYRTGDLARWLPNGTIEFLGRIDTQVKIRGYRVELGEIESRLAKHPAVEEAVVVVKEAAETDEKRNQEKYLCAYIVPVTRGGDAAAAKDLAGNKNKQVLPAIEIHRATGAQFEDHVKAKYDEIAVKSNGRSLTYGSLNNVANRAAQEITANYDDRCRLSKKERIRYKRQMLLHGWGIESQEKLKSTTVFVAGAGGGASPTIVQLALAGIGTIKVCDFDEVELSNLNRQFLHDEERLGMNKALSAQVTVGKINPHVKVIPYTVKLTRDNVFELVGDADIIFDMFDGPADKFVLSECAAVKKIPHIIISMTDINAYTAVCHTPRTPCYHCLFDRKKLETIVSGMKNQVENYSKNPLPVVATSLFISTGIAVNEALKILLGFKKPAYNKFFYFNQRGEEENLVYTPGYKAMTYLFSDHFLQACKEQGFDWDTGWRGNFLEELSIEPDPRCPLCSDEGKALRKTLEEKIKKVAGVVNIKEKDEEMSEGESLKTVGLLLDHDIEMAAAIMATLKAGKSIVPVDPASPEKSQLYVLEDSEVRVILTGDQHLKLAERLRDKCNRNIKIININAFNEFGTFLEKTAPETEPVKMNPGPIAYFLYPPDPKGNPGFNATFTDIYTALAAAKSYTFGSSDHKMLAGSTPLSNRLRDYLLEELPDYMVPSHFVQLDKIPLTTNGKVDRKALPDPAVKETNDYTAPGNELEEKLAGIWAEVLGVKKDIIGIDANFFGLGGHSLNATILVSRLHKELNVKFPLAEFFKMPTIKGLSGYILGAEEEVFTAIEPAKEKEYYRLSSAQKRLYALQQMEEHNIAYNMSQVFPLARQIDKEKLVAVFNRLIARHDTLRTSFEMVEGDPVQKIHDSVEWNPQFYKIDETGWDNVEQYFKRPFNLSEAPLLRVGLVEIESPSPYYYLRVEMHHIISDEVSQNLLQKEFMALYQDEELPPLRLQYKDYSEWQGSEQRQLIIKEQEKFWLEMFADQAPVLNLPTDYPRPIMQSFEGSSVEFLLTEKESRILKEAAEQTGATVYMSILSVFAILLSRLSGQEDIVVGTPIAARRHADLEKIIGMFVNTLAVRNAPCAEKVYREFLLELKEGTLKVYDNQEYPFEELADKISVGRDTGRNPVFDVMFNLVRMEENNYNISESEEKAQYLNIHRKGTAKFDLTLTAVEQGDRFLFNYEYCTRLFKPGTIDRFNSYFKRLLDSLSEGLDVKLFEMEIISADEKQRVLYEFNDTGADYPKDKTIHQMFEGMVDKTPDHIAVIGPQVSRTPIQITYRQLNEQSDRLAGLLIEKGVLPDTIVGIMMERSVEMVAGILGILKAGGAYMPIDQDYPEERINYMIKDSGAKLLAVANDQEGEKVRWWEGEKVLLEEIFKSPQSSSYPLTFLPSYLLNSSNLAYVIYTSGSTGKPKGVLTMHYNVTRVVTNTNYLRVKPEDRVLQLSNYAFDGSVFDIYGALLNSSALVMLSREDVVAIDQLAGLIKREAVTVFFVTTALFNVLVEYRIDCFNRIRKVLFGGERVSVGHSRKALEYMGKGRIIHVYGPTETTVYASYYFIDEIAENAATIPIGSPLSNTTIYILDPYMNPLPTGVQGEIYIGGEGTARGYLNRPGLTAEKFIAFQHSSSVIHHSKFYRTGDLARWDTNGHIEFLGRIDYQVKIRGFRIELGEIEVKLSRHDNIANAVVTVIEDGSENKNLCAYIAAKPKCELNISELREYLSGELPDYMVPSYFVQLEKIPVTANGKIDVKALPAPDGISLKNDVDYMPPTGDLEKKLVEIWEKVLGRDNIGVHENFFLVGGDSIKSIQIISRMNQAGYKLEMKDLFQYPVISDLARRVKKSKRIPDQSVITGEIPLSPIQGLFFEQSHREAHHFNQAVMFYSREGFDKEVIKGIFSKIQQHHDALRTTYRPDPGNGEVVQMAHGFEYPLSLEEFDLKHMENRIEEFNAKINEIQAGIDLEKGPLMKLALFHLEDGDRLLIVIHHLVIDGVSWRILFEDIETLYGQYKRGEKLVLPSKTDSYKLWVARLSEYANSKTFLKEKTYWSHLESCIAPAIKTDYEIEENEVKDTRSLSVSLGEEETNLLLTEVNKAYRTEINDILLTALGLSIKKTFGHGKVLLAMEGHGREEILEDIDISRTVGWFTSVYPVVLDVSYPDNLGQTIKETKEILRRIPKKGIGCGILKYLTKKEYKQEIEFKLNPQISFNYLGQFDADVKQKSFFAIAGESSGGPQSLKNRRDYEIDVSGMTANRRLSMTFSYNGKRFKPETMAVLSGNFESELKKIIEFCASREKIELTPSDFTYKGLSIEKVDRLMDMYPGVEDIYTLTPMQQGMLFHALIDNSSYSYFEQISYRMQGEMNIALVEKSMNELFKRHDILRTAFVYTDLDFPLQVVLRDRVVDFYYEDISKIGGAKEKEDFIKEFKIRDKNHSFDLSKDVLMRVSILQLDKLEYEFTWSFHHILMDGWCLGIINSEFFEIYTGSKENRPPRLNAIRPYRAYIQWLENQDKDASVGYWKSYLETFAEPTGIPRTRIVKNNENMYIREVFRIDVNSEKTRNLKRLAASLQVTLNIVAQAIWGILLGKYNGADDVVFGTVVSGRPFELEGVESMVGLFINTIPVRIQFKEDMNFDKLLLHVQESAIAGEQYHYHSLAEIQSGSILKQELIDHLFVFENYPVAEQIEGAGNDRNTGKPISFQLMNVDVFEQTNYDFNVVLGEMDEFAITFQYNGDAYDREFVQQIGNHLILLFDQVLENEKMRIRDLEFLSDEEKKRVMYDFNATAAVYPGDKTIHQLFAEQVERVPDNIAVVGPSAAAIHESTLQITYRELNEKSTRVAFSLQEKGVHPDTIVGIMIEQSIELILGILGILKAGGAYLPIDKDYPEERMRYMMADSKAKLLVTTDNLVNLPSYPLTFLPSYLQNSSNLAYIIYTSGSTGQPKGVPVEHRSLQNLCAWHNCYYAISSKDRASKYAGFSFDASVWEIFPYLVVGASLYIVTEPIRLNITLLDEFYEKNDISVAFLPSQVCEQFMELDNRSLRILLTGGDKLNKYTKRRYRLVNNYGPTEYTVVTTSFIIEGSYENIPIGRPIGNTQVYILSCNLQLQPILIPGELYISGDGLSRGYLNRPELTAEKFIDFHHSSFIIHHSKLYRTGDLVRWLPDGNIEFLGRVDHQVKIRGLRIELGEIEKRLAAHPQVKEAVTICRADQKEDKYLCAYIVAGTELNVPELREYLSGVLPDYMIPSYFVHLEKIPLTPNGKVDRRALPEPGDRADREYQAPRDKVEEKLVEIWADVLGMPAGMIGINSNFFQLGGHSLRVTSLASKIQKEFDVNISLMEIFSTPTIKTIASLIKMINREDNEEIDTDQKMEEILI